MNKLRSILHGKCFCKLVCIFLVIAYVFLKREAYLTNTFHLKIKSWNPNDTDGSIEHLRDACLSGQVLLFGQNTINRIANMMSFNTLEDVVDCARTVQIHNNVVLVSVINDAFLPFAYSWLCNTAKMDVHKSVLIITFDTKTRDNLKTNWNKINVFALNIDDIPAGDQGYSRAGYIKIMIRRTQIMNSILQADINLLLFEFDSVWFSDPLPDLKNMTDIDILFNPVSLSDESLSAGGLIFIYATDRSKFLWKQLTEMMINLGKIIENISGYTHVSEAENDQVYFSKLVRERYGNIRTRKLPLDRYSDGVWYMLSEGDRRKTIPIMINNNYIEGNINKLKRAKLWKHWFLLDNCTCDIQAVQNTIIGIIH